MLTQLITKIFTGEAGVFLARMRVVALLYVAMGLVGLTMVGFLTLALFVWLASEFGALQTALGFAAVCLVLIIALYVVLVFARRPPKQRASDRLQRDIASVASVAAISNLPLLLTSIRRKKLLLVLPAAGLGVWGVTRLINALRDR